MQPYAVVETGGKQYLVKTGDVLKVERTADADGTTFEIKPVLAVSDGKDLRIGTPELADAKVTAEVVKQMRGPKVVAYKKKRRKGYARKIGHRQELTVIKIAAIG